MPDSAATDVRSLEPRLLWNCFADLNAVPRPSKHEERVVGFVLGFAAQHHIEATVDTGGNVIVKKPASADRQGSKPVILQAHLDMVHKAAPGVQFDFANRGIEMWVDGDWVRARETTLGADNGLGAAAILAVLASTDLSHPPIEALFTVDEEQGMSGALALRHGLLTGKTLLNLDSEEDDTFTIGCAGGIDTIVRLEHFTQQVHGPDEPFFGIEIKGLRGGHSGLQIHEGRANAIKLMARILSACGETVIALHKLKGGSARNAIPAECMSQLVVLDEAKFEEIYAREVTRIEEEYRLIEPGLSITKTRLPSPGRTISCMERCIQRQLLLSLQAVVNGVYRMSPVVPGLVEASSNLSTMSLIEDCLECTGLQRSSVESSKLDVAAAFSAPFRMMGAEVAHGDPYPGWTPSATSPILERMKRLYTELFAHEVKVGACHAGLECGVIGIAYPDLDMISFGPNIHHAHSENECASISSTQKFWKLLTAVLTEI